MNLPRYIDEGQDSMSQTTTEQKPQSVREWARANGYDIKDTGRIPDKIVAAHREATQAR